MWAFQYTWQQYEIVKTKKAATELLNQWKKDRIAEGMTVAGSAGKGFFIAGMPGEPSSHAATIKQLPKDFTLEVNDS